MYVDTHCHLDYDFGDDVSSTELVEQAREAGVSLMITIGTDMASSATAIQTAARHDDVYAVVGIHPNDAMEATDRVMDVIERLARQQVCVGVGETGLDYYRKHTSPKLQAAAFRRHIELAKELDRTLVVHCREAWEDTLAILEAEGAPERVVMHCFSGDLSVVERCAASGYFMSYAGNVTFKNAEELQMAASATPLELLLSETDAPFLTPVPHRGKRNQPAYVPHTVAHLAELKELPEQDVAQAIEANTRRAFAIS